MTLNSLTQTNVLKALAAACWKIPAIGPTSRNDTYGSSYTDLDTILSVVKPILHEHGLWTSFSTRRRHSEFRLILRIHHVETGEQYSAEITFTVDNGSAHETASLVTYGRRYLLGMVLNLELGGDDDGNLGNARCVRPSQPRPAPGLTEPPRALSLAASAGAPLSSAPAEPERTQPAPAGPTSSTMPPAQTAAPAPITASANSKPATSAPSATSTSATAPVVDKASVTRGQIMTNLWARLKQTVGKEQAELILQEVVGTPYIRLVPPGKFEIVISKLEAKLAANPAA